MDSPKTIFYRRIKCPCKDCTSRSMDCHPNCNEYKEWQAAKDAERAKAYKKYLSERQITEYQVETYEKFKRRRNG